MDNAKEVNDKNKEESEDDSWLYDRDLTKECDRKFKTWGERIEGDIARAERAYNA